MLYEATGLRQRWPYALLLATAACGGARLESSPLPDGGADDGPPASPDAGDAAPPPTDAGASDSASDSGLPNGVHALATTDQTAPYDDLAPLLAMLGATPNVGLGESIHTSGGFEAMKARLVRYLVDVGGFRVLAIESPRTAAQVTGRYVETCAGTPTDAAKGIFGVFASDSMRDLLAWLCSFNQAHPGDTVQFVGFDVQQPWTDWDALRTWLSAAAPADAPSLTAPLAASCDGPQATSQADYDNGHFNDPYDAAHFASCGQALDAVDAYVAANQAAMTMRTSAEAYALGKLSALGLRSWQGEKFYYNSDIIRSFEARDLAMAPVYEALRQLYFPQKKALLWAHNYHLMRSHPSVTETQDPELQGARNMGSVLAQDLGDAYAPIGLSGWDVEINWPGSGYGPTMTPASTDLEGKLRALDTPLLLVDLHDPGLAPFLAPATPFAWGNPWTMRMVPADQWRAVVYFASSPPMHALFW